MARIELMELLLAALKQRDPLAYQQWMSDFLADLGYGDLVDAFDDALTHDGTPWKTLQ